MYVIELDRDEANIILKSLAMFARLNDEDVREDAEILRSKVYDAVYGNTIHGFVEKIKEREVQNAE